MTNTEKLDLDDLERANLGKVVRPEDWIALLAYARELEHAETQAVPEPALIQYRMRPTWEPESKGWTKWEDCSEESARDKERTPILHDWQYEVRRLVLAAAEAPNAES